VANIKSQKKRIRTNEAARMRNKAVKSELKTLTKHVQSAVAEGDAEKPSRPSPSVSTWLPPSMLSTRTRLPTASPVLPSS
jgi:hypothetical protein